MAISEDLGLLLSIGAVERETGLTKDVLRIWERRYGFPNPVRDANDERFYSADEVEKLRIIRQLMDIGMRPGKIVAASMPELIAHLCLAGVSDSESGIAPYDLEAVLALVAANKPAELTTHLRMALARMGIKQFITEFATPLCVAIGNAWATRRIAINQEHFFTEQLQHLLHHAIGLIPQQHTQRPRILLTTFPSEKHQLGLLMAQAYLSVEGVYCISLGIETPAREIVQAARAFHVDMVGLSFSSAIRTTVARTMLTELRQILVPEITLWAGGNIWQRNTWELEGCTTFASLSEVPAVLEAWRARQ